MSDTARVLHALSLTLLLCTPAAGGAQDRPNFSGTWIQVAPPRSSDAYRIERIEHQGDVLRVRLEERFEPLGTGGLWLRDDHRYTIGGKEAQVAGGRVRTSVNWEGRALVFLWTTAEADEATTKREEWYLSDNGRQLTRVRRMTDLQGTQEETVVFERR